ncbi:MAG: YifB family Mg chelatase-like AAA ATPase [Phycisphaeraceae bacterium]|nr:YifB family Mg chelatase-like AAA ATPase [Phycisphaeraceae bacterium]
MLARVQSYLLQGIEALSCEIEIDLDDRSLNRDTIVGLPDAAVKESLERVKAATSNSGYALPSGRLLVNLAPADVRKEGPAYDLPIAIGMLAVQGVVGFDGRGTAGLDLRKYLLAGELALDGRLRPIKGAIALASLARAKGASGVILPSENALEAALVPGVEAIGAGTLSEVVGVLRGEIEPTPTPAPDIEAMLSTATPPIDFAEVRGQESVKRAIVVAAAGGHNLLMIGPAGSGKSMMAKALPGVLPPLTPDEAIEITRIYSAAGALPPGEGLIRIRPVRAPHHTASAAAIVGGGMVPRPGEISLAHRGVLFLDELPEFPRLVLETLRQPMEDHVVTIARASGSIRFPASFMLVAAMNPTTSGDVRPGESGRREMERYVGRLSGPLLDRIDLHVEAPAVGWQQLQRAPDGSSTAMMREQVAGARQRQIERQGIGTPNSRLSGKQLDRCAELEGSSRSILGQALAELGLSARAYDKIRRVARTIADLAGVERIEPAHVAEAVGYRLLDRKM